MFSMVPIRSRQAVKHLHRAIMWPSIWITVTTYALQKTGIGVTVKPICDSLPLSGPGPKCRTVYQYCVLEKVSISLASKPRFPHERRGLGVQFMASLGEDYFLGPAKYQTMRPMIGNTRIIIIQITFLPVEAPLWNTFTIAQMSAIRMRRPMIVFSMTTSPFICS